MSLLTLNEIPHIMSDCYVCDERHSLVFLSLWGRDTAIQELLARLTLKNQEASLSQLTLIDSALNEHPLFVSNTDTFDKRIARHQQTRFGTLLHLWLFDQRCLIPDRKTGHAILLLPKEDALWQQRVWTLLSETCTLPLLEHWQDTVLAMLQQHGMLTPLPGAYGPLTGWQLTLDLPLLTQLISTAIASGELRIASASPRIQQAA